MWYVLLIVGCIIICALFMIQIKGIYRKKETSDWLVGDTLLLNDSLYRKHDLNVYAVRIRGWNSHNVFVEHEGFIHRIDFSDVRMNKSALWRRHHESCEKFMGMKPSFEPTLQKYPNNINSKNTYNGKLIDTLNETECEIYIAECLSREDYETATLIRKRLEKLR